MDVAPIVTPPTSPGEAELAAIRTVREECRRDVGGGGMCHEVGEWVEWTYGWPRRSGSYLSRDGEVCIAAHYWNVLPCGSILDCTADQTGEGHDMRVVAPDDSEHGRYDEERCSEWNPGMGWTPATTGMRASTPYSGEDDVDEMLRHVAARGNHWWATDRDGLLSYLDAQIAHATAFQERHGPNGYLGWLAKVRRDVIARRT